MTDKLLVLNVVALTPRLLEHMPRLKRVAQQGYRARLDTVLPAVTCSAQSTYLTGLTPSEHGIVANGWFFRDLGDILLWRQHSGLVEGERVWETIRRHRPDYRVANVCWWYAMGADVDTTITPRPEYHADGRKEPDCWTWPPSLHDQLVAELGPFPLFTFWGPGANIESSKWIIGATRRVMPDHDLTLAYIPHLDYDLQRFGPSGPEAVRAAKEVDEALAPLLDDAERMGATVVVLSEYGITDVDRAVDVNRVLRRAGLLHVHTNSTGEILDPWTSKAFAVADHQVAHVYVRDPDDVPMVRDMLAALPGVEQVLDAEGKKAAGLDHPRSGELVLVAEPGAWFTYYYWLDDKKAPDFARLVEIHKKPGYDPVELFMDPEDKWVKLRAGKALLRKKLGMRYMMEVVPLDPAPLRGSHGRLPETPDEGPVLLCSDPSASTDHVRATEVRDLLLRLAGVPAPA
ncbi:Predicted pyrophosphatase or phosphodiesterase, AlkP superfamily [Georgenia satyanarayanai]|uniref:Predicted pyrophosphatase or phosphodiesterase, AlkP superfamily n=1 Tax=Georgenia satyanarayanai TaxID=860221 RepID=A0A2Y9C7X1_9MICO|nr:nucleotide pyrophosphatase/phosphodiesterase family protein [Georgenia satyanarayanai]PYF96291.1 putative AlkP superfamily pyrophosphatase or phosphodiesterase [Georgenia satyanarayanai]SSA47073.1 Predicted pyrophosphatase or phosphodiesterase, AlkP superfamily [Georgenia satyanarayanai]